MFSTSTQKKEWTFSSQQDLLDLRKAANEKFRAKYETVVGADQNDIFLTPDEEALLRNIVTETGIRFADDFRPAMWPSTRWTAFAYFKRFFLYHSTMEYSPKSVMMSCFYLAAKVDEFNISIDEFVKNLKSGTAKSNSETILSFEPQIMLKLRYQLTVHSPFRPFEGHLIEMKTRSLLGFDLEQVRPHANDFFRKALFGDVMLLYPPSQIALAALKYALHMLDKADDLLKDQFLNKMLEIDTWKSQSDDVLICEKLIARLDEIIQCVLDGCKPIAPETNEALQSHMERWVKTFPELERRLSDLNASLQLENSNSNTAFSDDD
ncbi:cyclin domain-containing protein [Loa loa]|uniref:Cyclin domain-containing protein n=1 Tax=Loa loa TaxID=7209 RepID=A0A1I7VNA7_LOALO|nr:cyclin domain-containing protein [Loa loa]EFO25214.1 cyclin domain-containing protein [Loa loa]